MNTLVLPVDFGPSTEKLVNAAIEFTKEMNAQLHIIHVAPSDIGFAIGDMGFQYLPEVEESQRKADVTEMNRINDMVKSSGITTQCVIRTGEADEEILKYADEVKARLIIIGSHGRSGIYDVFIGSLTKEITKKSLIPVLVIPCHS